MRSGLFSDCLLLLTRIGQSIKSYIINDDGEQEWFKLARSEAEAELSESHVSPDAARARIFSQRPS